VHWYDGAPFLAVSDVHCTQRRFDKSERVVIGSGGGADETSGGLKARRVAATAAGFGRSRRALYRDGDDRGAVRLRPRAVIRLLLVVQLPDASHMSGHFFLAPSIAS
jgi:hypothetical protein